MTPARRKPARPATGPAATPLLPAPRSGERDMPETADPYDLPFPDGTSAIFGHEVADVHRELYEEHRELYGEAAACEMPMSRLLNRPATASVTIWPSPCRLIQMAPPPPSRSATCNIPEASIGAARQREAGKSESTRSEWRPCISG